MQCPDCGAYIGEEDQFCGECGRPVVPLTPTGAPLTPEAVRDVTTETLARVKPAPSVAPEAPLSTGLLSRRPLFWVSLAGAIAALLCACLAVIVIWAVGRSSTSAVPTASSLVPGTLLYEDDFEDPESGWDAHNDGDTLSIYSGGEYRLAVYTDSYVVWTTPEPALDLSDFAIEVEARQVEGPLDNNLGLLVRYQENVDDFYWFQISSDGYFSVDLREGGDWQSLIGWEASPAIEQGLDVTNRLRLVCRSNEFNFYVNDSLVTTLVDDAYATGNIGLAAGSFDEPGVVVHFDNLKVYALQD
jgi:hypothetical protein